MPRLLPGSGSQIPATAGTLAEELGPVRQVGLGVFDFQSRVTTNVGNEIILEMLRGPGTSGIKPKAASQLLGSLFSPWLPLVCGEYGKL